MTLAPLGSLPTSPATGGPGDRGTSTGDGGFAAAIDALLAGLAPCVVPTGPAPAPTAGLPALPGLPGLPGQGGAEAPAGDTHGSAEAALLAVLVTPGIPPALPGQPVATVGSTPSDTTTLADVVAATGYDAPAARAVTSLPTHPVTQTAGIAADAPSASADAGSPATTDQTGLPTSIAVGAHSSSGQGTHGDAAGDGRPGRDAQARPGTVPTQAASGLTVTAEPATGTLDATGAPSPSAVAPASPASPAATAAVTGTAPIAPTGRVDAPVPASPVTQVATEAVRMFQSGNGLHRVTLTLRPEALGEVRVSLSVKDGNVSVRIAASEHARTTLVEGAPELRRLLELVGASDVRVVVRDLSGGSSTTATAWSAAQDTTQQGQQGQQGRHQGQDGLTGEPAGQGTGSGHDDRHAGTRAGSTARDGSNDGSSPLRPDPVVTPHTRAAGVDVTV